MRKSAVIAVALPLALLLGLSVGRGQESPKKEDCYRYDVASLKVKDYIFYYWK